VTGLYFITDIDRTAVKIGLSRHPVRRLKDLQAGSPVQLVIEHLVLGVDRAIERSLHQHFAAHWRHREWFTYAPPIKALVEDLKSGGSALSLIPDAPYPKGYRCELGWLLTDEDTLRFLRDGVMPHP